MAGHREGVGLISTRGKTSVIASGAELIWAMWAAACRKMANFLGGPSRGGGARDAPIGPYQVQPRGLERNHAWPRSARGGRTRNRRGSLVALCRKATIRPSWTQATQGHGEGETFQGPRPLGSYINIIFRRACNSFSSETTPCV